MPQDRNQIELHYLGRIWRMGGPMDPLARQPKRPIGEVSLGFRGSLTALGTSLIRAAHSRLDPDPLIDDRWGDQLVPESVRAAYRELATAKFGASPRAPGMVAPDAVMDEYLGSSRGYSNVVMRTRYAEDALRDAIARGIRQYVIIGAGFDSFALRSPPFADGVAVFEIDQPSTQALKRQRLCECGVSIPASLHLIAANLAEDDLGAVLSRAPYDPGRPAFFSWLGVTMFLTREANLETLRAIARVGAPGSELVFTYLDEEIFASDSESFREMQAANRASGEPFQSGFDPDRLGKELRSVGLELLVDLSDAQLAERLARNNTTLMTPLEFSRIAQARVIAVSRDNPRDASPAVGDA
jgi:methyltransferase (TIGR00027 family)